MSCGPRLTHAIYIARGLVNLDLPFLRLSRSTYIMPFKTIKLNDGREIPEIGFGTWKIPQDVTSQQVQQGIEVGFDHVDTAQVSRFPGGRLRC